MEEGNKNQTLGQYVEDLYRDMFIKCILETTYVSIKFIPRYENDYATHICVPLDFGTHNPKMPNGFFCLGS